MSDKNQVHVQIGPGFLGMLTIILVVLKALGYLDISWWWALAPMLIPLSILFGMLGIALFVWMIIILLTLLSDLATKKGV